MRPARILWSILAVVAAAIAGHYIYAWLAPTAVGVQVPAGTASAAHNATPAAENPIATIPELLPNFTLADLHGKPVSVSTWAGQSLIINFWATWCAPCRREMPLLRALDRERKAKGMRVVGIAVDDRAAVAAYAAKMQIDYPLLVGEQDALDLIATLGVAEPAFPFSVFTDRRGRIVNLHLGELHRPMVESILAKIDDLDHHQRDIGEVRREIAADLARF